MSVVLPEEGPSTKHCKSKIAQEDCPDYSLTNIYALYSATCLYVHRKGKVSDLVRQFDETDSGVIGGERGGGEEGKEESTPRKRKKPGLKAFKLFESSGIIMGMVSSYVHTYLYVISY